MAMLRDTDRGRILTRRAFVIGGMQASLFALLLGRLYSLQVLQGDKYKMLAEENRVSTRFILPERGLITDRNGQVLARNQISMRAELQIQQMGSDPRETLRQLYALMPFDEVERKRIEKDLHRQKQMNSILLRDNLNWDDLSFLELHAPDLPGMTIESGATRNYPFATSTSHILGYIGAPTEKEAGDDPLLNQPGFRIGKSGVEGIYDLDLRGQPGTEQLEVNVHGRPVRELARREGVTGHDVQLTLDIKLQEYAHQRLSGERSASAVVMDAVDGSIYAMASHPTFDANHFAAGISRDEFKQLNADPLKPLLNKALQGLFAPGSTFKVVMTLAALNSGFNPHTHFYCPGFMDFGNHRFHCWKKEGHGSVDLHDAVVHSCDVYFYHLSQKIGMDVMEDMAKRLGLGGKVGIDLPHEQAGLMPGRAWKRGRFKQDWMPSETLIASIGQGYTMATPLQLATMTARIAGGGRAVQPHVMLSIKDARRAMTQFPLLGLNPAHVQFVQDAMAGVCQPGGTAYASHIPAVGYEMGGKTGTSQVRRISKAERASGVIPNEKRPWEDRDHALFISFAPVASPRYVCAVVIEHGGGGGKYAGPIARDILMKAMNLDPAKALAKPLDVEPIGDQPSPATPAQQPTQAPPQDDFEDLLDPDMPDNMDMTPPADSGMNLPD